MATTSFLNDDDSLKVCKATEGRQEKETIAECVLCRTVLLDRHRSIDIYGSQCQSVFQCPCYDPRIHASRVCLAETCGRESQLESGSGAARRSNPSRRDGSTGRKLSPRDGEQ